MYAIKKKEKKRGYLLASHEGQFLELIDVFSFSIE
jgi:hypothetical protein